MRRPVSINEFVRDLENSTPWARLVTKREEVQTLTSPNAQEDGAFGASVAISGSLAVVGAYNEVAGGYPGAGHAYTYSKGWLSS